MNWTGVQSASAQTNANVSDVHTFTSNLANQTWLTFTRAMGGRVMIPVTGPANQTLASFGSNFLIQGPNALPQLSVSGGFNTGNPNAGPVTGSDNYELRDMVTLTKGKHNLSVGGEFALDKTMFLANLNNYGEITFSTSAPTSTGVSLADFMTGQFSGFEQDAPYTTHLSNWHVAAFAQDNYRITPRFTANLGLRWDIDTPPVDAHNRLASFIPGQQSTVSPTAPLGALYPGTRASGAASPARDSATSRLVSVLHGIRLGTARHRFAAQRASSTEIPAAMSGTSPATPCLSRFATTLAPEHLSPIFTMSAFPSTAPGGGIFPYTYSPSAPKFYPSQSIEAIPPSFKDSSVYQFNLSVQRQLPVQDQRNGGLCRYPWPSSVNLRRCQLRALLDGQFFRRPFSRRPFHFSGKHRTTSSIRCRHQPYAWYSWRDHLPDLRPDLQL